MRARVARLTIAVCAAVALLAGWAHVAWADSYGDVSLALGQDLLALFPAAEGYVVSASGTEVYTDLAQKDLVRPGAELQVYRPGAEMIHPVTRQVLGSYEKNLGTLRLTEVREKYSRGVLDDAGAAAGIIPGDHVRLSSRRLRTLLHVGGSAEGVEIGPLAQALVARGEESGRFAMIDEPAWAPSLAALGAAWENVRADPVALCRLGELAAADLLANVRIVPGITSHVAIEVRSLRTGAVLGAVSERWSVPSPAAAPGVSPVAAAAPPAVAAPPAILALTAAAAPPAVEVSAEDAPTLFPAKPAPVVATPSPAAAEYIVRDLSMPARSLAAGNILGEGRLDVVLTDGHRLSLYRWEEQSLVWRWDEDGKRGRRILSLDAEDLDGDGRTEVLVTQLVRGRITSEIKRWRDGALQVGGAVDGVYLRAAPRFGKSALLFGQRAGFGEVLTGCVEQYRLREGAIERIEGSALPRGVGIFGLALAPEGGAVELYSLDRAGFISGVTASGAVAWRSTRPYGGYPPPLPARELFGMDPPDEQGFEEEMRAFQGRLLAEQIPGGSRLLVPRNFTGSPMLLVRLRSLGQGEIVTLEGPPESPEEARRSRAFDGYVADLARGDADGDGSPEILFVVNRFGGPLVGDRGKLVVWRPVVAPAGGK